MKALRNWLDDRTGYRALLEEALYEPVPGGARWRYVWGSALTFCLFVQVITGLFLWMAYSPSSQTAWESVFYIEHEMYGGWILRGVHHFTAQAMIVLLVLHLMQVVIDGAYRAPREMNFWMGLILMLLTMGLSLTGYLLPWDQKGFWATKVATNIVAVTPGLGPMLQQVFIGGVDYGHHTLTRFFAFHAGVLPGLLIVLVVGHIYLFRRHGLKAKDPEAAPAASFWPDQVLKDLVACLTVLAAVLFLVIWTRGAPLSAPADPSEPYSAARPEWYFLFLFQFLKYFPGGTEVWGAIVIPTVLLGAVFLMPFIGRWKVGHYFNLGLIFAVLAGAGLLTYLAMAEDQARPEYRLAVAQAAWDAERAVVLAKSPSGIPREGAVALLRGDPYTQGPRLFAKHCASCHRYDGRDGQGRIPAELASAPDLKDFASRGWLTELLDTNLVASTKFFGGTKFKDGKMVRFVRRHIGGFGAEEKAQLQKLVMALSAEAGLKSQREADVRDAAAIAEGRQLLVSDAMRCTECHKFGDAGTEPTAPELTGYGSRQWTIDFILNPAHERFYDRRNDRMPLYGPDKVLDRQSIELITDWLRGDWYEPGSVSSVR